MRQSFLWVALATVVVAGGAYWLYSYAVNRIELIEGTIPTAWTATDGVKWKTELPGPGSSSPVVAGDRVFVTCYSGYGVDAANPGSIDKLTRMLVCLDRGTGKILWTEKVSGTDAEDPYRGYLTEHGYASNTPAADGDAVYAFFAKSGVVAYDLAGKKLWQTSVGTQSDVRRWGSAASVVLSDKLVIVNAASEARAVIALDKKTGKEVWKTEGRELSLSFSTPALVKSDDRTELVVAMPDRVWGLDPATGKKLWSVKITPGGNVCPSVVVGEGVVYVTGGYQTKGTAAIKVGGSGDVTATHLLWEISKSSYVPTPVLHDGRLLNVNEDGVVTCLKAASGEVVYEKRLNVGGTAGRGSRPFYASPVFVDGRLYAVSRKSGVFVFKVGETLELAEQKPALDDSDFNATPAIAGKQLFLRSNKFIYCIADQ